MNLLLNEDLTNGISGNKLIKYDDVKAPPHWS